MAEKTLPEKKPRDYERRHATVMFADIAGFTAMSERMDPEEVTALMNQCFEAMAPVITRHEGTIDKFMGDGVMVLFGVPTATENAPKKAVSAAIELKNTLRRFTEDRKLAVPLDLHIGINTGEVLAGTVGGGKKKDYTVMGDTVNIASRLEELSTAGQILVGPETYRETKDSFEYRELPPVVLKGKEKKIPVWRLASVKEKAHRPSLTEGDRMVYSAMVGRGRELERLERCVAEAVAGRGGIVTIVGEAGIGKSRLRVELKGREIMGRVRLLEGRAISMGKNLPFHPIIDLIRGWAGITEEDDEPMALVKLEESVRGVSGEELDEIVPFVATLMGMRLGGRYADRVWGIEGENLERLITKSVRELLAASALQTPLVIMLEDLHWADESSLDLLESLMRLARTRRIVFVILFRPGFPDTGGRIVETIRERYADRHTAIELSPLDEGGSEALVNNLLRIKGLPYETREKILTRAGGNPFFIEEVVHSLIDQGVVVKRNGGFTVTKGIEEVDIPPTINDLLMARIDRLDEGTRELIKTASVIGRSFFYRVLAELARGEEDLDARLAYLTEVQLILRRTRLGELEYLFKHALAQEAAYGSLTHSQKRELHQAVARSIEKVFSDRIREFLGLLAYHYLRAEDEEKSYEYLVKAGKEALRSSASSEALAYYRDALALYLNKYGDTADRANVAMLEKNIALALFNKGQYAEAVGHFDRVLAYHGIRSPKDPVAAVGKLLLSFIDFLIAIYIPMLKWKGIPTEKDIEICDLWYKKCLSLGNTDANRLFFEAFYYSRMFSRFELNSVEGSTGVLSSLSIVFSFAGLSFILSRKVLEFCRDRINRSDVRSLWRYIFADLLHKFLAGQWDATDEYNDKLVEKNKNMGEMFYTSNFILFHGRLRMERGFFPEVRRMLDTLSDISEVYENDYVKAVTFDLNTELLSKLRRFTEAIDTIEEAVTFQSKHGFTLDIAYQYASRARIEILLENSEACDGSLSRAKEYVSAIERAPYFFSYYLLSLFIRDLFLMEKSIKGRDTSSLSTLRTKALRTGRKALNVVKKAAPNRTEAYRLMGTYWWLVGKEKKALKWWEWSIKEGERLGARLELSRTYFEVGKRLSDGRGKYQELNGMTAKDYLNKAREMFMEMDLQWDLDELEKVREEQSH